MVASTARVLYLVDGTEPKCVPDSCYMHPLLIAAVTTHCKSNMLESWLAWKLARRWPFPPSAFQAKGGIVGKVLAGGSCKHLQITAFETSAVLKQMTSDDVFEQDICAAAAVHNGNGDSGTHSRSACLWSL